LIAEYYSEDELKEGGGHVYQANSRTPELAYRRR